MDMGNYFNISGTSKRDYPLQNVNDLGVWGRGSFGNNAGSNRTSKRLQETGEFLFYEETPNYFTSTNSDDESRFVHGSGSNNNANLGNGHNEFEHDAVRRDFTSTKLADICAVVRERLQNQHYSARTGSIHCQRILGPLSSIAKKLNSGLLDLIVHKPTLLIHELSKMYNSNIYKANSIKSFYATIKHVVYALHLPEEETNTLLRYYDSELAAYENRAVPETLAYKERQNYINPQELEQLIKESYDQKHHFSSYVTGLIYALYPLRDDLTNIMIYTDKPPVNSKKNYLYVDGDTVMLAMRKTKTVPSKYPAFDLPFNQSISKAILSFLQTHGNKGPLLKGRRSPVLRRILNKFGINVQGGPVNYLRRAHAKHSKTEELDQLLYIMGHSAKTHGKHYL